MKHFGWEEVLNFIEAGEVDATIRDHLDGCSDCAAREAEVKRVLGALRFSTEDGPTEELIDLAWQKIVESRGAESVSDVGILEHVRRAKSKFEEIFATLVADSLAPSHAVRGTSVASPRLVVYETSEYSVSLSLTSVRKGPGVKVMGSVMPKTGDSIPPGGRAVMRSATEQRDIPLTEHGEFRFSHAGEEQVRIELEIEKYRIIVGPLPEAG